MTLVGRAMIAPRTALTITLMTAVVAVVGFLSIHEHSSAGLGWDLLHGVVILTDDCQAALEPSGSWCGLSFAYARLLGIAIFVVSCTLLATRRRSD